MSRRRRTGEVVDLVNFQPDWHRDVVANQLEVGAFEQVADICFLTGKEIVQANDVVTRVNQSLTEVGPKKSCPTGYQNSL